MNTMFFNAVSCFFVCAGLIIALILAINVIFHKQSMKIMNIVWVLTGLWGHYFALFAYYTFGIRKDSMVEVAPVESMKMDMKMCIHLLIHLKETGYALIIEILLQHQNQRSL